MGFRNFRSTNILHILWVLSNIWSIHGLCSVKICFPIIGRRIFRKTDYCLNNKRRYCGFYIEFILDDYVRVLEKIRTRVHVHVLIYNR